jgi:hypothetical protein
MLVLKRRSGEGIQITCPSGEVIEFFAVVRGSNDLSVSIKAPDQYGISRIPGRPSNKNHLRRFGHAIEHTRGEAQPQEQGAEATQKQTGDERVPAPAGEGSYGLFAQGICSVYTDGCAAGVTGENRDPA